jgi:pilus assembly protein CpaD
MTRTNIILRSACIAAVLLAGSCASPFSDGTGPMGDGAANHPITVAPRYLSLKLPFSAPEAGLLPDDSARFSAFVSEYLKQGTGSISISVPDGQDATAAIAYFGQRLTEAGVPRAHILVNTHAFANGDTRVELGYIGYAAKTDSCGDWSADLAVTSDNSTAPNFGCAVQQNIAAQVADPRDLVEPRVTDESDATRRKTVTDAYEKGQVTSSQKTSEQSGKVSDVGGQ